MNRVEPPPVPAHSELPAAQPHDPVDDSPAVVEAYRAMKAFGGDINRETARQLLGMWKHRRDLDPQDRVALLLRFPSSRGRGRA